MAIICWIGLQMVIVGRVRRGEGRYGVVCNYDFLFLLTTYYLLLLLYTHHYYYLLSSSIIIKEEDDTR